MADIDWIENSVAVLQWKHPVSRSSLWRTWWLGTSWKPEWTPEQDSKPTIPNNDRQFTENKINTPIQQAWNINIAAILGHLAKYETHPVIHFNTKKYYWLQHSSKCSYVTSYVAFIPIIRVKLHQWIRHVSLRGGHAQSIYEHVMLHALVRGETFSGVASPGWGRGGKSLNYIALHCIALHCIALHCIALHCIALHCIALHCIALHCIALHCIALHCIALHCIALHCIALHCIALHCIALHCIALHCIALHCIALHCIALHCIALHCIALHCIALHCIALHCIALHCIALHCIALHCIALHCIALHCIALHCIALHCIALHCIALHCIAFCIALHYITLHYITLHYITSFHYANYTTVHQLHHINTYIFQVHCKPNAIMQHEYWHYISLHYNSFQHYITSYIQHFQHFHIHYITVLSFHTPIFTYSNQWYINKSSNILRMQA